MVIFTCATAGFSCHRRSVRDRQELACRRALRFDRTGARRRAVLFDAIEFDEAIATCDVLYDLGFLLMDLWTRELRSHANLMFNRYLWICNDLERQLKGLSLLPLFLSLRAAIRAKVSILQPGSGEDHAKDARRHFEAACGLLAPHGSMFDHSSG